jgi:hypothetical protein
MCNGGRQLSHGSDPLDMGKIRLRLTQGLVGALALVRGGEQGGQIGEHETGDRHRQGGPIEGRDLLGDRRRGGGGTDGRPHPGVVHAGNGEAQDDGGGELLPRVLGSERQPQRREMGKLSTIRPSLGSAALERLALEPRRDSRHLHRGLPGPAERRTRKFVGSQNLRRASPGPLGPTRVPC